QGGKEETFHHLEGIPAYLDKLIKGDGSESSPKVMSERFHKKVDNGEKMEVALRWTDGTSEDIRSYVNGIRTTGGGTHESGLKAGIARAVKTYIATQEAKIKGLAITNDDIREGVVAVLSVSVREPMFQGQTKDKLNNPEMQPAVDRFVLSGLEAWLNA